MAAKTAHPDDFAAQPTRTLKVPTRARQVALPDDEDDTAVIPPGVSTDPDVKPPAHDAPPTELLEVLETRVRGGLGTHVLEAMNSNWAPVEVVTANTSYFFDQKLMCVKVVRRGTGAAMPDHGALGTHLLGGQRRYTRTMHMTRPFPAPGMEAVLARPGSGTKGTMTTSKVQKVVIHYQVASVAFSKEESAWSDVTSAFLKG